MKNRSRNEIIASMLEIISRGGATTRTKLMYGSFLSYSQLNEYLLLLLENGMISQHHHQQQQQKKNERDSPLFMITEKGRHFLNLYNQMNELIPVTVIQTN
jgi:predicted transcriptional regulator